MIHVYIFSILVFDSTLHLLNSGGVVFAPRMRAKSYRTMLEPLEEKYGPDVTALIYLTSLFGDVLWSAAILAALGIKYALRLHQMLIR